MPIETATLWVCCDCHSAHHHGDYNPTEDMQTQPWSLYDLSDGTPTLTMRGISPGLMASEHADDCAFRTSNGDEPCTWDGECEQINHSTSPCDACGAHWHGVRHAFTETYEENER